MRVMPLKEDFLALLREACRGQPASACGALRYCPLSGSLGNGPGDVIRGRAHTALPRRQLPVGGLEDFARRIEVHAGDVGARVASFDISFSILYRGLEVAMGASSLHLQSSAIVW